MVNQKSSNESKNHKTNNGKSHDSKVAVVDGSNVAYVEKSAKGAPKVSNLVAVRSALLEKGYKPIIIVDAALVHEIDDSHQLEALLQDQTIRQAPAATDADYFVLKTAQEMGGRVVSNDRFEPYQDDFSWINQRRMPLMIINGHVEFYDSEAEETGEKGG